MYRGVTAVLVALPELPLAFALAEVVREAGTVMEPVGRTMELLLGTVPVDAMDEVVSGVVAL